MTTDADRRPGGGAPGRPWFADSYAAVSVALMVGLGMQAWDRQWGPDTWIHASAITGLRADLFDPVHPMVGTSAPFEYYSPYSFLLAVVADVTGWSTMGVLQLAAALNLVLLLVALRWFVVELTGRTAVATGTLVATLLFWGLWPWRFSGFLSLTSIGFGLPYPSVFATALVLASGGLLLRFHDDGRSRWLLLLAVLLPLILLSHPFTAMWGTILLLALVVWKGTLARRDAVVPLLVVAAVTVVVLVAWPYYSFFELLVSGGEYDSAHEPLYERPYLRLAAASPGLVVLARRWRADRTDPLVLAGAGGLVVYGLGSVLDQHNVARVLPLVMLCFHIALGQLLADLVSRARRTAYPRYVAGWVGVAAVVGVVGVADVAGRLVPLSVLPDRWSDRAALAPITRPYEALEAVTGGSVRRVGTETDALAKVAPAYGLAPIAPGWPVAFVDDLDDRREASRRLFAAGTPAADREQIIGAYELDGILCATDACLEQFEGLVVLASGDGWTLLSLDAQRGAPGPDRG